MKVVVVALCICATFFQSVDSRKQRHVNEPLSWIDLFIMKSDGVDNKIIRALLLDAIPGANGGQLGLLLDLFDGGELSEDALMMHLSGDGFDFPEEFISLYKGGNMRKALLAQLSTAYGVPSLVIDLLLDEDSDRSVIKKHYFKNMVGDEVTPIQKAILESLVNGEDFDKSSLTGALMSQLLGKNDVYTQLGMKSLLNGNRKDGLAYLFLSQTSHHDRDFYQRYPRNEAVFAYVAEQTANGKINASTILDMALGEKINALNPDATFFDLFGVKAFDFVCAAHHDDILLECQALSTKFMPSPLECVHAGCCYRATGCYENVLGKIGLGFASNAIDEEHVTGLLGGTLPDLANFWPDGVIPWIPSTDNPASAAMASALLGKEMDFLDSYKLGNMFLGLNPTSMPDVGPNERRPNFVWKPHGVTAIPTGTVIPGAISIVNNEYQFGGPPDVAVAAAVDPLIAGITGVDGGPPSCMDTAKEFRQSCVSNTDALAEDGDVLCANLGCCYAPDYSDLSVPACFTDISHGQCYNVTEKRDCGFQGITQDECVSNPRCCWDSTTTNNNFGSYNPWCFYKKNSIVLSDEGCARSDFNEGCFSGRAEKWNSLVSESSCEAAGCCYYKAPRKTFLQRYLYGSSYTSDVCFKPASIGHYSFNPLEVPPATDAPTTDPDPVCKYDSNPVEREDCGKLSWFGCYLQGCCYQKTMFVGAPWCFRKS